ncbi:aspartyl-phosphate phosphatase Spo0E family protein [Paenibacillus pinistramenti]|uniref:aspartyl-phosphate phosphatase Spo0E family protein n=1 Tax=Paenibacillus pinistramenti TaxID=1768003 RepID=UPI001107D442|nr:aspartyl-phosphate phosphatase Spo0E family protein [Paenibacillus pinistramenti]
MTAQTPYSAFQPNRYKSRVSEDLNCIIESLRRELVEVSATSGFTSDIVLELSQRLDKYIVLAQRQMKVERRTGLEH